jgi:hypothetical protein
MGFLVLICPQPLSASRIFAAFATLVWRPFRSNDAFARNSHLVAMQRENSYQIRRRNVERQTNRHFKFFRA